MPTLTLGDKAIALHEVSISDSCRRNYFCRQMVPDIVHRVSNQKDSLGDNDLKELSLKC